jgi:hypothetical protein
LAQQAIEDGGARIDPGEVMFDLTVRLAGRHNRLRDSIDRYRHEHGAERPEGRVSLEQR